MSSKDTRSIGSGSAGGRVDRDRQDLPADAHRQPPRPRSQPSTKGAHLVSVSVPVSDLDRAKEFYLDTLGFELRLDNSWREGMRWIEVVPENSPTSLMLVSWSDTLLPKMYRIIVVSVDDIRVIHEELGAKGVSFELPPTKSLHGTQAMFRDPDGNALVLWERSSSALREGMSWFGRSDI